MNKVYINLRIHINIFNIFIFHCLDETSLIRTFKNQISSLVIDISTNGKQHFQQMIIQLYLHHIFTMFTNLQYLNFGPSSICVSTIII